MEREAARRGEILERRATGRLRLDHVDMGARKHRLRRQRKIPEMGAPIDDEARLIAEALQEIEACVESLKSDLPPRAARDRA